MPRSKKPTNVYQRTVKVFAESEEQMKRWQKAAQKENTSLSRFVREVVDSCISGDRNTKEIFEYEDKILELQTRNSLLLAENSRLNGALKRMEQSLKTTENELRNIKYGSYLDKNFSGERELSKELVKLFKGKGRLREEDIVALLHIDPSNSRANEIILNQLNILFDYGLIHRWRGGYEWKK